MQLGSLGVLRSIGLQGNDVRFLSSRDQCSPVGLRECQNSPGLRARLPVTYPLYTKLNRSCAKIQNLQVSIQPQGAHQRGSDGGVRRTVARGGGGPF